MVVLVVRLSQVECIINVRDLRIQTCVHYILFVFQDLFDIIFLFPYVCKLGILGIFDTAVESHTVESQMIELDFLEVIV